MPRRYRGQRGGEDGGSEGMQAGLAICLRWTGRLLSAAGVHPGHQLALGSLGAVLRVRVRQWVHGNANMPAASAARPETRLADSGRAQPRRCGRHDWAARQARRWHPARFRRRRRITQKLRSACRPGQCFWLAAFRWPIRAGYGSGWNRRARCGGKRGMAGRPGRSSRWRWPRSRRRSSRSAILSRRWPGWRSPRFWAP